MVRAESFKEYEAMWLGSELSFYTGISSGLSRVTEIAV
jgi:hypothetical protein